MRRKDLLKKTCKLCKISIKDRLPHAVYCKKCAREEEERKNKINSVKRRNLKREKKNGK